MPLHIPVQFRRKSETSETGFYSKQFARWFLLKLSPRGWQLACMSTRNGTRTQSGSKFNALFFVLFVRLSLGARGEHVSDRNIRLHQNDDDET